MKQLLYLEVPTPHTEAVKIWLQHQFSPPTGQTVPTGAGIIWQEGAAVLSILVWSLQRTTYLKVYRWSEHQSSAEGAVLRELTQQVRRAFPFDFSPPPPLLEGESVFTSLSDRYPLTVKYFQKFAQGEADLQRVYWWEQRWRQGIGEPQPAKQVLTRTSESTPAPEYDLVYVGGALGAIHGAMMAKLGYRVCLIERLGFGRMNREWNISRAEFEGLVQFGLFTQAEFESLILAEYEDGFNKFFDGNNPQVAKANILHTPTVLNIAIDSSRLLQLCGEKLLAHGATIFEYVEFESAQVSDRAVTVFAKDLVNHTNLEVHARVLVDAMGSASAIAQQLNQGKAFDSVCPTVGAVLSGLDRRVWDRKFGDVLNSHGDISRGRQLIWELFPGEGDQVAVYLFHYHQVDQRNPGSLLEMYEDFFTILPEYRTCDLEQLTWHKPTFGYIPGYFSLDAQSRTVAFDRLLAIGDAAALQSPLVFTGFGSLVRNLPRLTFLLDLALKHDLLTAPDLNQINAYQSNIAVTWLFSKGMMVPSGAHIPPERINSMLNTFFGVLADQPSEVSDRFIKDRLGWWMFNRLAVVAALRNPALILWIWQLAGTKDMVRWLRSYGSFTVNALNRAIYAGWLPHLIPKLAPLFSQTPRLWLKLCSWSYALNYSVSKTT
ncbi:MAG: flavin-dependent dehydrogenase [Pseudanabaenaceae cyanobacterium bins.68]|nr:flavin-dependent dehydrogenase [Pseudanabaenaceae cyanobacterium bins.68]